MKTIIILFLAFNLYADTKQDMFNLYQNEKFSEVCKLGFSKLRSHHKDEEFISLYGFACLNSDYIDRLAIPISLLKSTRESRANSAYFSVILMQKKLLYHALVDNYDLSSLELPTTDYILSKVFDLYAKLKIHEPRLFYLFEDPNDKKLTYKLYIVKEGKLQKIVIEEFYDAVNIKRHIYW